MMLAWLRDLTSQAHARWNAEHQVVEFGVKIGEDRGVVQVPWRVFQRLFAGAAHPRAVRRSLLPTADPVREHC